MKKTILATVLLSGLVLSVAAPTALAAKEDTSKIEVELTEDDGHKPSPGPHKDNLSMVYVPTSFKFSNEVSTGSLLLENQHAKKSTQYLAVNDDRKDTNGAPTSSKWVVTGKLSKLETSTGAELEAKLNLKPTVAREYLIGTEFETVDGVEDYKVLPVVPTADEITGYSVSNVSLIAGEDAVPFFNKTTDDITAPKGAFTNLGDASLAIATGNAKVKGTYNGTIDWVLAAQ